MLFLYKMAQRFIDAVLFALAWFVAYQIRFGGHVPALQQHQMMVLMVPVVAAQLGMSALLGIYRFQWRYIGTSDALCIARAHLAVPALLALLRVAFGSSVDLLRISGSVIAVTFVLTVMGALSVRVARRWAYAYEHSSLPAPEVAKQRFLLVGAGEHGATVAREMVLTKGIIVVGFVDDDPHKRNAVISGVPVLGPTADLPRIVADNQVDEILVCVSPRSRQSLQLDGLTTAQGTPIRSRIMPTLHEILKEERQRNVLLIGGAGYIGSALLPKLLESDYRVRLLDSFVYGKDPIAKYLDHPNLEVISADFRQVDKLVEAVKNVGAVIHLGAIVGDPACAIDEELTIEVNLIATRTIAEVAKGQGVSRFIFASTCSVYGASDELLNERSALNPVSLYARSKIACEKVLLSLHDRNFLPVMLRFGTIYGISGRTRFDLVVNLLAAKALVDHEITVFGGDQWRPFLHVDDAAAAVFAALQAEPSRLQHRIYNVGSDEQNFTLGQIGEMIRGIVPTAELKCTDGNVDRRNYRVDFSRIRESLGFRCVWTVEDGVRQVLDAIASGRVTNYRDACYSNVKFLTEENGRKKLIAQNGWAKQLVDNWQPVEPEEPSTVEPAILLPHAA